MTFEYEGVRRIVYGGTGTGEAGDGAWFVPVCPNCGRFVKADKTIAFTYDGPPVDEPNATCARCGRVQMPFEGYP